MHVRDLRLAGAYLSLPISWFTSKHHSHTWRFQLCALHGYCYWCLVGRKWAGALTGQDSCSWFLRDACAPVICYWTMIFSHFAKSVCWTEIQELELESGLQGKVSWGFCRTLTKVMDWWTALPGMCVSRLGLPPGTRKIPLILFSSENWRWVVFKVECLPHFLHTWIK